MKTTITKEFKWESAHRLWDPNKSSEENKQTFGNCYNLHGHSYKLFVTVSSFENMLHDGMIMNFTDLKRIVNSSIVDWQDHSLNLTKGDPLINSLKNYKDMKINIWENETTCENQLKYFWELLEDALSLHEIILTKLKLYETESSFCELTNERK